MGTSKSAAELSRKLNAYAESIPNANREAIGESALLIKDTVLPLMAAATGGDLRLSGVGRPPGAKIGVRYDVKGSQNPTALVRATGPAHFVEWDVKPHTVVAKRTARRTSRRGRIAAVEGGDTSGITGVLASERITGGFAKYAKNAGGSKGRHPFERGVNIAQPRIPEHFGRVHNRALLRAFR